MCGKKSLVSFLLLAVLSSPAHAAFIPYFRMDSLAFMSSDIVLCDEISWVKKTKQMAGWGCEYHEGTYNVVQVLKGKCQPKDDLVVELYGHDRETINEWGKAPETRHKMPLGRALLFLDKKDGMWRAKGVKPIIDGEAYTYGQFISNPGGLWLARMKPENFDLPAILPYGEVELLRDLQIAQEKAKGLAAPVRETASHDLIREGFVINLYWVWGIVVFILTISIGLFCCHIVRGRTRMRG